MNQAKNIRISKKGNELLQNRRLAKKVAAAIVLHPEQLYNKQGLRVEGLVIKSSTIANRK